MQFQRRLNPASLKRVQTQSPGTKSHHAAEFDRTAATGPLLVLLVPNPESQLTKNMFAESLEASCRQSELRHEPEDEGVRNRTLQVLELKFWTLIRKNLMISCYNNDNNNSVFQKKTLRK